MKMIVPIVGMLGFASRTRRFVPPPRTPPMRMLLCCLYRWRPNLGIRYPANTASQASVVNAESKQVIADVAVSKGHKDDTQRPAPAFTTMLTVHSDSIGLGAIGIDS